jgi:hypothetical protein
VFLFYLVAAVGLWILCLGPSPTFLGEPLHAGSLYRWLLVLPGFDALRVPARFFMLVVMCLAVCAGLAFARIAPRAPRARAVVFTVAALAMLSDGWPSRVPLVEPPPRWAALEQPGAGPLLELPATRPGLDLQILYRGMFHGRPLVNGYSGHFAPHYGALRTSLTRFDHDLLSRLSRLGVRQVAVNRVEDPDEAWVRYVSSYPGVELVGAAEGWRLFRLPRAPRPASHETALGAPLPIVALETNVNTDIVQAAIDGDRTTRWHTGPQRPGTYVEIGLGAPRTIAAVRLELGPYAFDFPRALLIEVLDAGTWTVVWQGSGAGPALAGALEEPRLLPVTFAFEPRVAQQVRLTQQETDSVYYWSIAELAVLPPAPP